MVRRPAFPPGGVRTDEERSAIPPGRSLLHFAPGCDLPSRVPGSSTGRLPSPRVGAAAAIFDVDRTVLARGSGPAFSAALRAVGVLRDPYPGESLLFRAFDMLGETYPSLVLVRQGPRMARGWRQDLVQEAGRLAAPMLRDLVPPGIDELLAEHHAAGDAVALATGGPFDLVEPFARMLGVETLLATRFHVVDGCYDGAFEGPMVWGRGKLAAVRAWAASVGVDLARSSAYSDSFYDLPLLNAVGRPVAVNPDIRLAALAHLRGWTVMRPRARGSR